MGLLRACDCCNITQDNVLYHVPGQRLWSLPARSFAWGRHHSRALAVRSRSPFHAFSLARPADGRRPYGQTSKNVLLLPARKPQLPSVP
jgi:hypothetical protein